MNYLLNGMYLLCISDQLSNMITTDSMLRICCCSVFYLYDGNCRCVGGMYCIMVCRALSPNSMMATVVVLVACIASWYAEPSLPLYDGNCRCVGGMYCIMVCRALSPNCVMATVVVLGACIASWYAEPSLSIV